MNIFCVCRERIFGHWEEDMGDNPPAGIGKYERREIEHHQWALHIRLAIGLIRSPETKFSTRWSGEPSPGRHIVNAISV